MHHFVRGLELAVRMQSRIVRGLGESCCDVHRSRGEQMDNNKEAGKAVAKWSCNKSFIGVLRSYNGNRITSTVREVT